MTDAELAAELEKLKIEMELSFERGEGLPEGLNEHEARYFECLDENISQIITSLRKPT